mgnify:CR=1 FL=1
MIRALSLGGVLAGLWLLLSGYIVPMLLGFGVVSVSGRSRSPRPAARIIARKAGLR